MNARYLSMIILIAVGAAAGGYWWARRDMPAMNATAPATQAEREVLYWYDPMVPNQHFDQPGKSPFMDMELVPKYAEQQTTAADGVRIDAGVAQNLGIRLAKVQRGVIAQSIGAAGNIVFNQRDVAIVQARTDGFVTRVYRRAPGDVVAANAPLVDLLVPEWDGAQAEFLALLEHDDAPLIDAARRRLTSLGMPAALITEVEQQRRPQTTFTVSTPLAGVIDALEVRTGMTIGAGATLARINGLDTVWLEAQIPEAQSGAVTVGGRASATLAAYPGETFTGEIITILPETNIDTRTVRVRVELRNPRHRLRPGMFAQVRLDGGDDKPVLFVPSEAVIRSGTRNVAIVALDGGGFAPTEIQIGSESNGKTAVLAGLEEGQQVVASGQFLIDSEASLQGALTRLATGDAMPANAAPTVVHEASGRVASVSASEVVIAHDPVPSLGWGAMTMPFKVADPEMTQGIEAGDVVHFQFTEQNDGYAIQQLHRLERAP